MVVDGDDTKNRRLQVLAVVLAFLIPRAWIYAGLPKESWAPDPYPAALAARFWDYVWVNTLVPPLDHAVLKAPIALMGLDGAQRFHGFLLTTWALDAVAIYCVWRAIMLLNGSRISALWLTAFYSVLLIPFELWRANYPTDHRDHPTVVMAAFFALGLALLRRRHDARALFVLAAASALYLLQSSAAVAAVPAGILVAALSLPAPDRSSVLKSGGALAATVLVVIGAVGFLVARTYVSTGTFQLSTRQGPALLMFVQEAYDYDDARVRQLAERASVPAWYLWCFDHARSPLPPGDPDAAGWHYLSTAYGTCMPFTGRDPQSGASWPFDYSELVAFLKTQDDPVALRVAAEDDRDTRERRYLFYGSSPELSPKWIAYYGAQSQRVATRLLMTDPVRYIKTAWRQHLRFARGAEYFAVAGDQLHTQEYPLRTALVAFSRYLGAVLLLLLYVSVPAVLIAGILRWVRERSLTPRLLDYLVLAAPVAAQALLFSATVATENERYFVQITPFLIVIGALLWTDAARRGAWRLEAAH